MRVSRLVTILALMPSLAFGQSAASEGVRALVRGDTMTAFRTLRPLAEAPHSDPVAQFFLAALLETHIGGGGDVVRACGLYQRSMRQSHPFADLARLLAAQIRGHSSLMDRLCNDAMQGVWREPPPATFILGPDHSASIQASLLTIRYRGTERSQPVTSMPGWHFLPTGYTSIAVPGPTPRTRHFLDYWAWSPDDVQAPTKWFLIWSLCEVLGADAGIIVDPVWVSQFAGATPPSHTEARSLGRLHLNDAGQIERIVTGLNAGTVVLPDPGAP